MLQFPAVQMPFRTKLAILMAMHAAWGVVLWFSISKYGLGISTDSVQLLFGGKNLAAGNGLVSYDGSFLNLWPPLYPALLALVRLMAGANMLSSATILQAAAFVGLSACLSILFLETFRGDLMLALAANALADIGAVVLTSFDVVGSDYIGLFLIVLSITLTGTYLKSGRRTTYVALAVVGMLAMLDRYLAAAAIATSAACVTWKTGRRLSEKLGRGLFIVICAAPAVVWLAITARLSGARPPITLGENFSWFSKSILEWILPTKTVKAELGILTVLLWVVIIGMSGAFVLAWRGFQNRDGAGLPDEQSPLEGSFLLPTMAFGVAYLLLLFSSASITYFNKLGGRFLLPLYIPFVTLLVAAVAILLQRTRHASSIGWRLGGPVIGAGALIACAALILQVTVPLVSASHTDGAAGGDNVFNTREWNKNQTIAYWREHVPAGPYRLTSNEPDAVAFFTGQTVFSSPRSTSGPYGTESYALSSYAPELPGATGNLYLIWIEPSPAAYFYTVDQLAAVVNVNPLFESEDGGVYELTQKSGP